MKKALFVLEHLKRFYNNYKQDDLAEFTIDIDDYNRIEDGILELNATCDTCKYGYTRRQRCSHEEMFFFDEYSIYMDIEFCCKFHEPKE